MGFVDDIKMIQRIVGADADGVFGPATAAALIRELVRRGEVEDGVTAGALDDRTRKAIATLDAKARPLFEQFVRLAKATAATFGCDYIGISGNRTYQEQEALYAKGRTAPGQKVTNAKAGQSNHNFGIAMDFGVFRNGTYLDESKPDLAEQVHRACAVQARAIGMVWGGDWKTFPDIPHFEVFTGLTLEAKRNRFEQVGSVLA